MALRRFGSPSKCSQFKLKISTADSCSMCGHTFVRHSSGLFRSCLDTKACCCVAFTPIVYRCRTCSGYLGAHSTKALTEYVMKLRDSLNKKFSVAEPAKTLTDEPKPSTNELPKEVGNSKKPAGAYSHQNGANTAGDPMDVVSYPCTDIANKKTFEKMAVVSNLPLILNDPKTHFVPEVSTPAPLCKNQNFNVEQHPRASSAVKNDQQSSQPALPRGHYVYYQQQPSGYQQTVTILGYGLVGLLNHENNCYLNSVIQCLSNASHFRRLFVTRYGEQEQHPLDQRGPMCSAIGWLLRAQWEDPVASQGLHALLVKRQLAKVDNRFSYAEQQDVFETLTMLLDCLHEELNNARSTEYKVIEEKQLPYICDAQWDFHKKRNDSPIVYLFHGLMLTTITKAAFTIGKHNYYEKETYSAEPFHAIILDADDSDAESKRIEKQLDDYFSPLKSSKHTAGLKYLWLAPNYLIVYLRRFERDRWGHTTKSERTHYECAEWLDATGYTHPQSPARKAQPFYHLIGVICHRGTMTAGHYYCYAYNDIYGKWYLFNDGTVRESNDYKNDDNSMVFIYQIEKSNK